MLEPIIKRSKKAGETASDILADYSSRMFDRLGQVAKTLEAIEAGNQKAAAGNQKAQEKITAASTAIEKELNARNEVISGILKELFTVFQESGEELSGVNQGLREAQAVLHQAQAEIEKGAEAARAGKFDVANVQMLARTAKLFTQVDAPTVKIALMEFQLASFQQALEELSERRWLEIEGAVEAARRSRNA